MMIGSLLWGGASASSSNAEMRAYYVDPGSSTHQAGKIIAIDVVGMRVHKFIDYPEHRNLTKYGAPHEHDTSLVQGCLQVLYWYLDR
jgi:hypothetical protein